MKIKRDQCFDGEEPKVFKGHVRQVSRDSLHQDVLHRDPRDEESY